MYRAGAPEKLVRLLKGSPSTEAAHRALLALRILSDREADRLAVMNCGGIPVLVQMLSSEPHTEAKELAAAVLGNMAAGNQIIKDKIVEVGRPLSLLLSQADSKLCMNSEGPLDHSLIITPHIIQLGLGGYIYSRRLMFLGAPTALDFKDLAHISCRVPHLKPSEARVGQACPAGGCNRAAGAIAEG